MKLLINLLRILGLPLGAAAALAILIVEGTPLGLSELSQKTGYAKSHLSLYMKTLASRGLVELVRDGRRIYYKASNNALSYLLKEHLSKIKVAIDSTSSIVRDEKLSNSLDELAHEIHRLIEKIRGREVEEK